MPPNLPEDPAAWFRCPACGHTPLTAKQHLLLCPVCGQSYSCEDGIYDLRPPR